MKTRPSTRLRAVRLAEKMTGARITHVHVAPEELEALQRELRDAGKVPLPEDDPEG